MQNFFLILNMVAPVFLMVAIGYLLKRLGIINDNFVSISSKVVFTAALPALIFKEISTISLDQVFDIKQIAFVLGITLITFFLGWLFALPFTKTDKDRGAFIQGSFRGNYAIVGLALIVNILGEASLAKASLILSFVVPLYNVLTVFILTLYSGNQKALSISNLLKEIFTNPLIIAIIISLPFSYYQLSLPWLVTDTIDYLANLTLPLALIGIGGFLKISELKSASTPAFLSSGLKIVLFPLIGTAAAYLFGYRGSDLGILFIVFGCPTAIASFIMAEAMGSNSRLAGNIVLITTLGSILTISAGLFILKQNGLI